MKIIIKEIKNNYQKTKITRNILESLSDWFEDKVSVENYIENTKNEFFFVAYEKETSVGFISIKETSRDCVEIAVMGVIKEYQNNGIGKLLFETCFEFLEEKGYLFIQVKTVKQGIYPEYDQTNFFYQSLGFKELEVINELWDENNPCQIYIMAIK